MKIELKYGLIIGILAIIWILIEFFIANNLGRHDLGVVTGLVAAIIPIIGIIAGLREARHQSGNRLSTWDATRMGLVIATIYGAMTAIFTYAFLTLYPDATEQYLEYLRETLLSQGKSADEIRLTIEQLRAATTPLRQAAYFLGSSILTGGLFAFVVGYFMNRKKRGTHDGNAQRQHL